MRRAVKALGLALPGKTDWFAGPRYLWVGSTVQFVGQRPIEVDPRDLEARIGLLSAAVDFESRDNIFTPSSGTYAELEAAIVRPGLGASSSFDSASARAFTCLPVARAAVPGLRGQGDFASDGVPFYAEPFARKLGMYAGLDVARRPEETAIDIQVGSV